LLLGEIYTFWLDMSNNKAGFEEIRGLCYHLAVGPLPTGRQAVPTDGGAGRHWERRLDEGGLTEFIVKSLNDNEGQ
jgi:hypothetical protein